MRPFVWLSAVGLVAVLGLSFAACRNRSIHGELVPPKDAEKFSGQFARTFDDDFTPAAIQLQGRAPNDVLDQRLFASRLGHSDLVALCSVNDVWGKGRYQGRQEQFVDVRFEEMLIGALPKGTYEDQLLVIDSEDDLPGDLQGKYVLLFLKWAPGEIPPYHHHLMPAQDAAVNYINALVAMAKDDGVLNSDGEATKNGRAERKRRRRDKDGAKENDALKIDSSQEVPD